MNLRVRNHQPALFVALVATAIALLMDVAVAQGSKKCEAKIRPGIRKAQADGPTTVSDTSRSHTQIQLRLCRLLHAQPVTRPLPPMTWFSLNITQFSVRQKKPVMRVPGSEVRISTSTG